MPVGFIYNIGVLLLLSTPLLAERILLCKQCSDTRSVLLNISREVPKIRNYIALQRVAVSNELTRVASRNSKSEFLLSAIDIESGSNRGRRFGRWGLEVIFPADESSGRQAQNQKERHENRPRKTRQPGLALQGRLA